MTFSIQRYRTPHGRAPGIGGRPRTWWLLAALLTVGLWFIAGPNGQGLNLWSFGLADIGWQHLAAAAETTTPAAQELPSDAEMIAHFLTHRAEFEELVRLYQTNTRSVWRQQDGKLVPFETDEYKALLKRLRVLGLSSDGALWLPDPYSVETAARARRMDAFHAYAYHGILISAGNLRFSPQLGRQVMKGYFYVPLVPRVENGLLWWPRSRYKGTLHRSARVLESLDKYPPGWFLDPPQPRRGECVFRQFEPQWFLQLCNH